MHGLHFSEGKEEGDGGFGALIFADAIDVETVAAAARGDVVKWPTEIVASEEPIEGAAGFGEPGGIIGGLVGFDAGGNGGLGFDGLLVEFGAFLSAREKAVGADGTE